MLIEIINTINYFPLKCVYKLNKHFNIHKFRKSLKKISKKFNIIFIQNINENIIIKNDIFYNIKDDIITIICSHSYYDYHSVSYILNLIDKEYNNESVDTKEIFFSTNYRSDYLYIKNNNNLYDMNKYSKNYKDLETIKFFRYAQNKYNDDNTDIYVMINIRKILNIDDNKFGNYLYELKIDKSIDIIEQIKKFKNDSSHNIENLFLDYYKTRVINSIINLGSNRTKILVNSLKNFKLPSFIDKIIDFDIHEHYLYERIIILPTCNKNNKTKVFFTPKLLEKLLEKIL